MLTLYPDPRLVPEAYVRASQVAECLGRTTEQVVSWCKAGNLPALEDNGYWVRVDDFKRFLSQCTWELVTDHNGQPVKRW